MARKCMMLVVALFFACGPRQPGAVEGEVLFWQVTQSQVTFNRCTDDASFREQLQPIAFDESTYLVYRIEEGATKASALSCETLDRTTCIKSSAGVVFDVNQNELLFSDETESPLGNMDCRLRAIQNWVLTDQGTTLVMEISNVLGLVGDEDECERVEKEIIASSPNQTGLQGCVVQFDVSAELR